MYAKTLVTALIAVFSATSALAADTTADDTTPFVSTLTRAEVHAATLAARAAGLIAEGDTSVALERTTSTKTRVQVRAELAEAVRIGAISRGDNDVPATQAQLQSIEMAGLKALAMTVAAR